ncbi:hypothetical protein ACLIBH_10205 [Virgibacillus sp. W0430]
MFKEQLVKELIHIIAKLELEEDYTAEQAIKELKNLENIKNHHKTVD